MQLDEAVDAKAVMLDCMDRGLIVCIAKSNVLRIAPPLTIDQATLEAGIDILLDAIRAV